MTVEEEVCEVDGDNDNESGPQSEPETEHLTEPETVPETELEKEVEDKISKKSKLDASTSKSENFNKSLAKGLTDLVDIFEGKVELENYDLEVNDGINYEDELWNAFDNLKALSKGEKLPEQSTKAILKKVCIKDNITEDKLHAKLNDANTSKKIKNSTNNQSNTLNTIQVESGFVKVTLEEGDGEHCIKQEKPSIKTNNNKKSDTCENAMTKESEPLPPKLASYHCFPAKSDKSIARSSDNVNTRIYKCPKCDLKFDKANSVGNIGIQHMIEEHGLKPADAKRSPKKWKMRACK